MSAIIFNGKDAKLLTGRDLLDSSGNAYAKGQEKTYTAAACRAAKWSTSGAGVTIADDTTAADLPRAITSPIGQKITGVSGSSDYAYYRLTLDPADYNTKLKVQLAINPLSGYVSNDFKIDVYSNTASAYNGTSTRLALSTDTSSVTGIPNATGTFRTTFDAPGSATPYIELRIGLNGTNTHSLVISDVIVGPGTVVQGAAVTQWQSYTPVVSGLGSGTISSVFGQWRRVGESVEVMGSVTISLTAGTGSTNISVSVPVGSIDSTKLPNSLVDERNVLGHAMTYSLLASTQFDRAIIVNPASSTAIQFLKPATNHWYQGADAVANSEFAFRFTYPVADYAGAGTVNIVQNDLSYYYSSGNTWGTTNSSATTSQGQGGVSGGTTTPAGTSFTYTFSPSTPVPVGTKPVLELSPDQKNWNSVGLVGGSNVENLRFDGTNNIGAAAWLDTSGKINVSFGKYPTGTGTQTWAGVNGGTWFWRVTVGLPGQAIGFGQATDSSSGLVSGESYGNFTGTFTGFTAGITTTLTWARLGKAVVLSIAAQSGTSNATTFTITGLPSALIPANDQDGLIDVVDSGASSTGKLRVRASTGIIEIYKAAFSAFTASGSKGFSGHNQTFTYVLI